MKYVLFASWVALLFATACQSTAPELPPNVIVILADDLGYGDISPYDGWIETPQLDRLAREGIRFTDFHSNGPVCSPTRAAFITGRYQQRAGIPGVVYANPDANRHHGLQLEETTIAELFKQAGYATGMYGKWHLGYEAQYNPSHQGFDDFKGYVSGNVDFFSHVDGQGFFDWWHNAEQVDEPGYVTHLINQHALAFVDAQKDQPFFLYLAHEAPHYPYQGPNDEAFRKVGEIVREQRDSAQVVRAYTEMVQKMDKGIGELLDELERLGLREETFIFFFSDNGAVSYGSNGPLRGFKGSLWEGGHRVPAIASWPGQLPQGTTTSLTAVGMDLAPTLLEVAGIQAETAPNFDGRSFFRLIKQGKEAWEAPRSLFWSYRNQAAVRQGPWKLVMMPQDSGLFQLDQDLAEGQDLWKTETEQAQRMLSDFRRWKEDVMNNARQQPERPTKDVPSEEE